jgi:predicted GIY-YIG superfamily endonuclease
MIYLIHFSAALGRSRHYVGYCREGRLDDRIREHRTGRGAALIREVNAAGIAWEVVRTWEEGDRATERHIKKHKNGPKFCPVCSRKPRELATTSRVTRIHS